VNISTLRTLLLTFNVLLVLGLGGLIGVIVLDIRDFQSADNQVILGPPSTFQVQQKSGHTEAFYSAIYRTEIGIPAPEATTEPEEIGWEESFLERWKVLTAPMVRRDPGQSCAVLADQSTGTQKMCKVAEEGKTIADLRAGADALQISPGDLPTLVEDLGNNLARVAGITKEGVVIANAKGDEATIPYEAPDTGAAIAEAIASGGSPGTGGGPVSVKDMFDRTRPVGRDTWEIGREHQLDLQKNYAKYIDEVTLRPFHDRRTRRLQGIQIRKKVASPMFAKFGLRERDIIVKVNGRPVTSSGQLTSIIEANKNTPKVEVEILRNGRAMTMTYLLRRGAQATPGKR
jgi:hypothetical protein